MESSNAATADGKNSLPNSALNAPSNQKPLSFAAAILKGNSVPAASPASAPAPVKKASTPSVQLNATAKSSKSSASAATNGTPKSNGKDGKKKNLSENGKSKKEEKVIEKPIPLTAGSAWANRLNLANGPIKPNAPTTNTATKSTTTPAVDDKSTQPDSKPAPSSTPEPSNTAEASIASTSSSSSSSSTSTNANVASTPTPAVDVSTSSSSSTLSSSTVSAIASAAASTPAPAPAPVILAPSSSSPIVTAAPAPIIAEIKPVNTPASTNVPAAKGKGKEKVKSTSADSTKQTSFADALKNKLSPSVNDALTTNSNAAEATAITAPSVASATVNNTSSRIRKKADVPPPNPSKLKKSVTILEPMKPLNPIPPSTYIRSSSTQSNSSSTSNGTSVDSSVSPATAPVTPSSSSVYIAPTHTKFGLVEKKKLSQHPSHPSHNHLHPSSFPRRDMHRPMPMMSPQYTPYPLSPYQLFLLDPRNGAVCASMSALNNVTGQIEELSGAPVDAVPLILIPSPIGGPAQLTPLCELVAQQLTFYFSVDNLVRDTFLRRQMNARGYISFVDLLTFPRIRSLTSSSYYLSMAAASCLAPPQLDQDGNPLATSAPPQPLFKLKNGALRLRHSWYKWVFPRPASIEESDDEEKEKEKEREIKQPQPTTSTQPNEPSTNKPLEAMASVAQA